MVVVVVGARSRDAFYQKPLYSSRIRVLEVALNHLHHFTVVSLLNRWPQLDVESDTEETTSSRRRMPAVLPRPSADFLPATTPS